MLWPNGLGVGLGQWVQVTIDGLKSGQKNRWDTLDDSR